MPCCIDRMRFSSRFTIRKEKQSFLLFFSFFYFFQVLDLYVAPILCAKKTKSGCYTQVLMYIDTTGLRLGRFFLRACARLEKLPVSGSP